MKRLSALLWALLALGVSNIAYAETPVSICMTTNGTNCVPISPTFPFPVATTSGTYNTIAASQSAQVLTGGSGGATGDYLSHCVVVPASTSPGVVTILDNAVTVYAFPGGASSLSNLVPFAIPVDSKSVSGAWKVTTGANVSVVCTGKFT